MKVQHVAETAIGEGRTEDGNVVLGRPVADGGLVVDLESEATDELARRPGEGRLDAIGIGRTASTLVLLLL